MSRFQIFLDDDSLKVIDSKNKVIFNKSFSVNNNDGLNEIVDYLNELDVYLRKLISLHLKSSNELFDLKNTISTILGEEIKDCELLVDVDPDDLYVQGRLVELHNLMKVLL